MRFIQSWSYTCANVLMNQLKESHDKRSVYYYGFQVIIGAIVKIVLLVTITLLLGTFPSTISIVLVFGSLRMFAGGYHMDTYGKCIATSLGLLILSGALVQYTYQHWQHTYIALFVAMIFLAALLIIVKWAPADTPNKPITEPSKIRKFKILSIIYLVLWLLITICLMIFKLNLFVLAGCFGIVLGAFMITPLGYKLFDGLSGKIDLAKK